MLTRFMRSRPSKLKIAGAAAALLALGLLASALLKSSAPPSVKLPNGDLLALELVRYQEEDYRGYRMPGLRFVQEGIAHLLSRPTFRRWTPGQSLVVWLSCRDAATKQYRDFSWWKHAVAVDQHGCEFDILDRQVHAPRWNGSGSPLPKPPADSKYILASAVLRSFPRREKTFRIRFYDDKSTRVAEMEVPNPVYGEFPEWTPQELPARFESEDWSVLLNGVTNQPAVLERSEMQVERFQLQTGFEMRQAGQATRQWELSRLKIEDATGNHSDDAVFTLCTNEPAWSLTGVFYRTEQASYSSNEVWSVGSLALPKPGEARALDLSQAVQGVQLRLCAMGGPGKLKYSNGVPVSVVAHKALMSGTSMSSSSRASGGRMISEMEIDTGRPHIVVSVDGLKGDQRLTPICKIRGQTVPVNSQSIAGDYRLFIFDTELTGQSFDLQFVVHQPRVARFQIRPPVLEFPALNAMDPAKLASQIPARDPAASGRHLDLQPWYNLSIASSGIQAGGPLRGGSASTYLNRAQIPQGLQEFAGIQFDVRGLVQLDGLALRKERQYFPKSAEGMAVGQKARALHFLHGTTWTLGDETIVGEYVIRYADGQSEVAPIRYGADVRSWYRGNTEPMEAAHARVVWEQEHYPNGALYHWTWRNPRPEVEIVSIDFRSRSTSSGPFLAAITAEP